MSLFFLRETLQLCILSAAAAGAPFAAAPAPPDLIVHHGRIITADGPFRQAEAMAIRGERIVAVGDNGSLLALAGPKTEKLDLAGRTVLPGLIDSHTHPVDAALYEFDHRVPAMECIADVLGHIHQRALAAGPGEWIRIEQVFVTRLRERRFPTRLELDMAAPDNPVCFCTGPDAALNSLALKLSGIDKTFQITDGKPGRIERDPATGEPTGILRSCERFIKGRPHDRQPTFEQRCDRLVELLADYNAAGITSYSDRDMDDAELKLYQAVKERGELSCRVFLDYHIDTQAPLEQIAGRIAAAEAHPLHRYDNLLWLRGLKIYIDGGMLTGSAYMRQPWGVSQIYSITDPQYRGMLYVQPERLYQIAKLALEHGFQLTGHAVGDGAVQALVDAYERVAADMPIGPRRPCVSHSNFMSREAIQRMARLGIVADLQPAWLWLDGATLRANFGDQRLAWFQPLRACFEAGVMVAGGSDHMQKIGSRRSINPYNPFLGMWIAIARQPRWTDAPLHPEQALSRSQAIRFYTINCAYLTFEEQEKGSLEPGKLADFIVIDRDILTCPADEIKDIEVLQTWLGGRRVHRRLR